MPRLLMTIGIVVYLTGQAPAREITVACWNVQNLFDNRRDTVGRGEYVLTGEELHEAMTKKAQVIRFLNADVVGLVEVENQSLLRTLCEEYLDGQGYDYFMLVDETDPRGIDVGIIAKMPFTAYSFEIPGHTRGILACRFAVHSEPFYVLVSHWKSRIGGGGEIRMSCARRTLELTGEVIPRYEGRSVPVIVMGDLNDNDGDESVLALERGGLINALKKLPPDRRWTYPWWDSRNKLVHYNQFDHILLNKEMADRRGIDWVPGSAQVLRPGFMLRKRVLEGTEYQWVDSSYRGHVGCSDHLPVAIRIRVPERASVRRR